jgi:hypothetical protein
LERCSYHFSALFIIKEINHANGVIINFSFCKGKINFIDHDGDSSLTNNNIW